jgi:CRP-like cAMP-binding protein
MDNIILASLRGLSVQDVELQSQEILYEQGEPITRVYFPRGAIVSLVISLSAGESIEAAMVGRDGIVGAAAAMDGKSALSRAVVQIAGPASVGEARELRQTAEANPSIVPLLFRHEQALYAQAQQSAACIANHQVEARLARWLLRARDLSQNDALPFTQEFLAEMLGVGRPSVSIVAHKLQEAGFIKYSRGRIQIQNVEGLRETTCECYEAVNQHYKNLLGYVSSS